MGRTVEFRMGGGIELRAVSLELSLSRTSYLTFTENILKLVSFHATFLQKLLIPDWSWMVCVSLCRRTALSSTDPLCSTPRASLILQETCTTMRVWSGTSCACVPMGLCSVCRWSTPTWAARLQISRAEKLTRTLTGTRCLRSVGLDREHSIDPGCPK